MDKGVQTTLKGSRKDRTENTALELLFIIRLNASNVMSETDKKKAALVMKLKVFAFWKHNTTNYNISRRRNRGNSR